VREPNEQPLLFIDINLGDETSERIVVYDGDSAKELSVKFCEEHSKFYLVVNVILDLDEETQEKLEE
jgi:hypothetical protein